MTIHALYDTPGFEHVAESHSRYENDLFEATGEFPPIPVLERTDAAPRRIHLKKKMTDELTCRATMKIVSDFFRSSDSNFMHHVINLYLNDIPASSPLSPSLQTAAERITVRIHNRGGDMEWCTAIINSYL
ncbi:MAG: hypothetical protein ACI9S8_002746 [Chlamydiales bacterium]|jgi:hypothetical protein